MLSDVKVKNAKADGKRMRLADAGGLYLDVQANGIKTWLFRYSSDDGKRHWKTIGQYPVWSLSEARSKALELRKMQEGLIPSDLKTRKSISFKQVADEYLEKHLPNITSGKESYNTLRRLELHVYPLIGDMKIGDIRTSDVYNIVERLEKRNTSETARKVSQLCSRIFRFAMLKEYCDADPCYALRGEVGRRKKSTAGHLAAIIEPEMVSKLMKDISVYPQLVVRLALRFSAYTFCRPGEVRHAEWDEINFEKAVWSIPSLKMKARRDHLVPLAPQVVDLLRELQVVTGHGKYLFPNCRAPKGDRPMGDNTVLVALRSMGYTKEEMTAHGFRSMASTLLNENNFNRDHIEMQLAHQPKDKIRGIYNRAQYWDERVKMMAWYADYLDKLRDA